MSARPAPLVSIVVPVFNRAHLLHRTIASVLAQTLEDWEMVIVDDASRDDPETAVEAATGGDRRVRVLRHSQNRGVSAARNTGIEAARGRYVALLDSDDTWRPEKLERQVAALRAEGDPDDALCTTRTEIRMPGGWTRIRPKAGPGEGRSFAEFLYNDGGFAQASSFLLPTRLAQRIPFRVELRQYEDHLFFIELGAAGARYILVPEALTLWHNDDRLDRLGSQDDVRRAERFLDVAGGLMPPHVRLAFEARALGHVLWRSSRARALQLLLKAGASGAVPASHAAGLLARAILPGRIYAALRRGLTAG